MKFGAKSKERLATTHSDMQKIMNLAIKRTPIDYSITEGQRSIARQRKLFKAGKSKLNPDNPGHLQSAKHLVLPKAHAVDFAAYVKGKPKLAYDFNHICVIWGVMDSCAKELYAAGKVKHVLRWGGNWDMDGEVITDQGFDDLCHVELFKPR